MFFCQDVIRLGLLSLATFQLAVAAEWVRVFCLLLYHSYHLHILSSHLTSPLYPHLMGLLQPGSSLLELP